MNKAPVKYRLVVRVPLTRTRSPRFRKVYGKLARRLRSHADGRR